MNDTEPRENPSREKPSSAEVAAARVAVRGALSTLSPRLTMERDGLVLVALDNLEAARSAARMTAAADAPPYSLSDAPGAIEIREIGTGTIPVVEAVTKGRPVLVFAGDTILGGKQNRFINVTIWLKEASVTQIPVTCLELGRWTPGSAMRFGTGRKADYALRSMVNAQVSYLRRRADPAATEDAPSPQAYASDQGEVWAEIGRRESRAGRHSATSALHELYESDGYSVLRIWTHDLKGSDRQLMARIRRSGTLAAKRRETRAP